MLALRGAGSVTNAAHFTDDEMEALALSSITREWQGWDLNLVTHFSRLFLILVGSGLIGLCFLER